MLHGAKLAKGVVVEVLGLTSHKGGRQPLMNLSGQVNSIRSRDVYLMLRVWEGDPGSQQAAKLTLPLPRITWVVAEEGRTHGEAGARLGVR